MRIQLFLHAPCAATGRPVPQGAVHAPPQNIAQKQRGSRGYGNRAVPIRGRVPIGIVSIGILEYGSIPNHGGPGELSVRGRWHDIFICFSYILAILVVLINLY